jgi:putative phage-type endonuclease
MINYYENLEQGSEEWAQVRCGLLTASEMKYILTPTLKIANNDKTRTHLFELLAQRITNYVEPHYFNEDMLRGQIDEVEARQLYNDKYAPVTEMGFITNQINGATCGYSPDGLVGNDGLIEIKSRRQKYQVETILGGTIPEEYLLQVQTGLLISERSWCDFISYSAGLPMVTLRVYPDERIQAAIIAAVTSFEEQINERMAAYLCALDSDMRLIPTERKTETNGDIVL